ncbi:putative duf1711 domain-containing protein [Erysiphe neolycopersici]|uniref:Putative duf1711 domain-containing protein n=1 Tax=Erysiphe neolycopersici TaxID=212602 RepID=A0A420HGG2_9PEZI|nr:putative duf1711 domain-containing protein [Erysiphe neolycopersici]
MAPSNKSATSRRKSTKGIVVLKLSPKVLQKFQQKLESKRPNSISSTTSSDRPKTTSLSTNENTQSSKSLTPDQPDTPRSSTLPPPTDGSKKKSNKRANNAAFASEGAAASKARGKPGPKKKSKLEDTTPDQISVTPKSFNTATAKLGPKANQGAINAGLRALDRSGKPCRKWAKESFKLKSFTGVCWEIPRWKAPPKTTTIETERDSNSSSGIKAYSQLESERSEKSNNITDIEVGSTSSNMVCSPAPQPLSSVETRNTSVLSSPVVMASA